MTSQVDAADDFLRPLEELAAERQHRSTQARLGYVRGRIHAANGDVDAARESFETALTRLKTLPLPYERARVNFAYGQTLRRAGKAQGSRHRVAPGTGDLRRVGRPHLRQAVRQGAQSRWHEREALQALLTELTRRAVGGQAGRRRQDEQAGGRRTVHFGEDGAVPPDPDLHKLGLRSRSELAAQYHQLSDQGNEPVPVLPAGPRSNARSPRQQFPGKAPGRPVRPTRRGRPLCDHPLLSPPWLPCPCGRLPTGARPGRRNCARTCPLPRKGR